MDKLNHLFTNNICQILKKFININISSYINWCISASETVENGKDIVSMQGRLYFPVSSQFRQRSFHPHFLTPTSSPQIPNGEKWELISGLECAIYYKRKIYLFVIFHFLKCTNEVLYYYFIIFSTFFNFNSLFSQCFCWRRSTRERCKWHSKICIFLYHLAILILFILWLYKKEISQISNFGIYSGASLLSISLWVVRHKIVVQRTSNLGINFYLQRY